MTAEEQRRIANGYLNGWDGLPKNEKKGWETMRLAADAGDAIAAVEMAKHIVDSDPDGAVAYLEKGGEPQETLELYPKSLYLSAAKTPAKAKENFAKANSIERLNCDGFYYLAKLSNLADPNDKDTYKSHLNDAVVLGSELLTDEDYAACGRERGVVMNAEEFERFANRDSEHKIYSFASISKDESMARAIMEANLDDKRAKALLGGGLIKQMKGMKPEAILEYEPVYVPHVYADVIKYSYTHQERDSVTRHSGTGVLPIDEDHKHLRDYKTAKPLFLRTNEMESYYHHGKDEVPDNVRIRVSVPNMKEKEDEIYKENFKATRDYARMIVENNLSDDYNWSIGCISVSLDIDSWDVGLELGFVPCWFFHYQLDKQLVTVRVNASSGAVDYFFDNPYGIQRKKDEGVSNRVTKRNKRIAKIIIIIIAIIFGFALVTTIIEEFLPDEEGDTTALPTTQIEMLE